MAEEKEPPLSPVQRSRIRRLSQPHEHDASEAGGELNIVPFLDIIMNVLMFVLATIPAVFTVTIESNPPSIGAGNRVRPPDKPTLNLSMLIVSDGVSLKASGGAIGAGCDLGGGITVPKRDGHHDWPALTACVKKLKDASPDFKEETTVQILADPGTDYQTIIQAMDAVRGDPEGELLFPDVNFGVAK